jgi:D-xylose transport system substrate-binding protein
LVIAYDRLIRDADLYVSFDPVHIGEVQAQYLVAQGHKRIVRIHGASTDQNAHFMKQGQDKVLAASHVTVVHEDWAENWKPEQAKKIMNAAISKHGHTFDAVLAANDGTAGGAIQALIEEGIADKVVVTGQDAELVACQRIAAGSQAMTIYKPIDVLAAKAAELAVKLATGRPVIAAGAMESIPSVLLDVVVVDKANLEKTVVDSGFHSHKDVFGK